MGDRGPEPPICALRPICRRKVPGPLWTDDQAPSGRMESAGSKKILEFFQDRVDQWPRSVDRIGGQGDV